MYNKVGISKSSPENSRFMCGEARANFIYFLKCLIVQTVNPVVSLAQELIFEVVKVMSLKLVFSAIIE